MGPVIRQSLLSARSQPIHNDDLFGSYSLHSKIRETLLRETSMIRRYAESHSLVPEKVSRRSIDHVPQSNREDYPIETQERDGPDDRKASDRSRKGDEQLFRAVSLSHSKEPKQDD